MGRGGNSYLSSTHFTHMTHIWPWKNINIYFLLQSILNEHSGSTVLGDLRPEKKDKYILFLLQSILNKDSGAMILGDLR